jgi:hypothetical protein
MDGSLAFTKRIISALFCGFAAIGLIVTSLEVPSPTTVNRIRTSR